MSSHFIPTSHNVTVVESIDPKGNSSEQREPAWCSYGLSLPKEQGHNGALKGATELDAVVSKAFPSATEILINRILMWKSVWEKVSLRQALTL